MGGIESYSPSVKSHRTKVSISRTSSQRRYVPYDAIANGSNEVIDFRDFQVLNPQSFLVDGTNVIAVQLLNRASNSSDAWFDGGLTQSFGGQSGVADPSFQSNMPAFQHVLSNAEIWAVLAFIKSRWPPKVRTFQDRANAREQ